MYKYNICIKMKPYDWFCGLGSHIYTHIYIDSNLMQIYFFIQYEIFFAPFVAMVMSVNYHIFRFNPIFIKYGCWFLHWGGYGRVYAACIRCIISKMALRWVRETERRRIVEFFFFFFAYKKYSLRFIKFRLNPWWQMDFPGDDFHTFLDLNGVIYLAVNGTVTSLTVFI